MAEAQAQRLACELLAALLHLHEVGVAHRDIKPGNVLCTTPSPLELAQDRAAHGNAHGNGGVALMHVKLADFGLRLGIGLGLGIGVSPSKVRVRVRG